MKTITVKLDTEARHILDPVAFTFRDMNDTDYATRNLDGTRHIVHARVVREPAQRLFWGPALGFVCDNMVEDLLKSEAESAGVSEMRYLGSRYTPENGMLEIDMEPVSVEMRTIGGV